MLVEFDDIIEVVLHHEGGYVNDPDDPGGETNFGVAKRSHPDVDIANLTKDGAKEIYKEHYWDKNKVESLSEELRHIYFDMCVNQGRGRAVKILQRAANAKGAGLKVDGGMVTNDLLMQFQSDILDVSVIRPEVTETTALGAAYAAGLAVGFWSGFEELKKNWSVDKVWKPQMNEENREKKYKGWKKAVEKTFDWVEE